VESFDVYWSGRRDLNSRPPEPHAGMGGLYKLVKSHKLLNLLNRAVEIKEIMESKKIESVTDMSQYRNSNSKKMQSIRKKVHFGLDFLLIPFYCV